MRRSRNPARIGSGKPSAVIHRAISSALCQREGVRPHRDLDTPLGRNGSMSMGSQRRRTISASPVELSFFPSRILMRFALREKSAGFTSFNVI